jgi:hypothetical protein
MSINSKAIQLMGIDDKSTGDVGQGGIGRIAAKLPTVDKDHIEASSLGMIKGMNRRGLTTFGVLNFRFPERQSYYRSAWVRMLLSY